VKLHVPPGHLYSLIVARPPRILIGLRRRDRSWPFLASTPGYPSFIFPVVRMASRPFTGLILTATLRSGFLGSIARQARWLQRDDIVRPFAHYSLSEITMMIDDPNHSNWPASTVTVRRPS
jgi:hypothetical protein